MREKLQHNVAAQELLRASIIEAAHTNASTQSIAFLSHLLFRKLKQFVNLSFGVFECAHCALGIIQYKLFMLKRGNTNNTKTR